MAYQNIIQEIWIMIDFVWSSLCVEPGVVDCLYQVNPAPRPMMNLRCLISKACIGLTKDRSLFYFEVHDMNKE